MAETVQVSVAPAPGTRGAGAAPVEGLHSSPPSAFHLVLRQLCEEHDREVALLKARLQACSCHAGYGLQLFSPELNGFRAAALQKSCAGDVAAAKGCGQCLGSNEEGAARLPDCVGNLPSRPEYHTQEPPPPPAESLVQLQVNSHSKGGDKEEECVAVDSVNSVEEDEQLNCGRKSRDSTDLFNQGDECRLNLTHPLGISDSSRESEEKVNADSEEDSEDESVEEAPNPDDKAADEHLQTSCQVRGGLALASKAAEAREAKSDQVMKMNQPPSYGSVTYVTQPAPKNRSSLLSVSEPRVIRPHAKPRLVGLRKEGSRSILRTSAVTYKEEDENAEESEQLPESPRTSNNKSRKTCSFADHRVSWAGSVEDLEETEIQDDRESIVCKVNSKWVTDEVTQSSETAVTRITMPGIMPINQHGRSTNMKSKRRMSNGGALLATIGRSNTNLLRSMTNIGGMRPRSFRDIRMLVIANLVGTPNSAFNFYWDMISLVLICYDIVMIPMEVFDLTENLFLEFMGFVTGIFWSCDVVRTFFTGYFVNGDIEMRMKYIAWNYVTSWFFLDVGIVSIDWVRVVMKYSAGDDNEELQGRLKNLRAARALRLLRGVKLRRIFTMIEDRLHSESMAVLFTMVKLFGFLVIINHLCACVWYFIGKTGQSHMESWLDKYILDSHSFTYRYLTSYHWALTQFTPASISVQPHNVYERAFGVIVLLFALVSVSSFVSGITGAVMSLRSMASAKSKNFWLLRRYLAENDVPVSLAMRIQRYCDFAYKSQEDRLAEANVKILGMLSSSLRQELNTALHEGHISWHPMCVLFGKLAPQVTVVVCNNCVSRLMIVRGNTCFRTGQKANVMYITTRGELLYAIEETGKDPEEVVRGMWACEHPLWCEWTTLGSMVAKTNADMVTVDAEKFANAVHGNLTTRTEAVIYANHFVQGLNRMKRHKQSDLYQCNSIEGLWLRLYTEYGVRRTKEGLSACARQGHANESMQGFMTSEAKLSYMTSQQYSDK